MNNSEIRCPVCKASVDLPIFRGKVLNKHDVSYYRCGNCKFVFTEDPFWLDEAYTAAISELDIGLIKRNLYLVEKTIQVINSNFNYNKPFLDYAGGYGMFVRIMRDEGYDFYRQDKYCENLFAKYFDVKDFDPQLNLGKHFELLTALEVFEHLQNPMDEISKMFFYSDSILFTTEIYKDENLGNNNDWWYFSPVTGQHISFYNAETFKYISKKLSCNYYNDSNIHMLTFKKFEQNPLVRIEKIENPLYRIVRKSCNRLLQKLNGVHKPINVKGKLMTDYDYVKSKTKI